jgi:aldose sugar dehydrogenase
MKLLAAALLWASLSVGAHAESINAGDHEASADKPFTATAVAEFDTPWAIAFLPDGRMLVTEKPGRIFLVSQQGEKIELANVPAVAASGQNGLLDIAIAPDFSQSSQVYLTYVAPFDNGDALVLARATLKEGNGAASLEDLRPIWTQTPGGRGQPGGIIVFDAEGKHLFLTVGDRMQPKTAQDPENPRGKLLRLNLDGTPAQDNPDFAAGGIRAETWTAGHRNPYGLAFDATGRLWLHEMGPRGGDEFNLIEKGANYGWPLVSNGDNYSGTPIPRHDTRPEFTPPPLYWNPVIAPAGLTFYKGKLFPEWQNSALIGGLASMALIRVTVDEKGGAKEADRWDMQARIRDVAVAPDGAVWVIEDDEAGRLLRLVPGR